MKARTVTTLGELRIGDSFIYNLKRVDVWKVIALKNKNGRVAVNQQMRIGMPPVHKYDELKRATKIVVFLRHTIPQPGEECYIEDLLPGDVFHKDDDVIHEWLIIETGHDFYTVRRTDEAANVKAGRLAKVVFIKHGGE